jgi:hypothetical protein
LGFTIWDEIENEEIEIKNIAMPTWVRVSAWRQKGVKTGRPSRKVCKPKRPEFIQFNLMLKIMKKNVMNLLRAGVFVLAAVAAFAFTTPFDPMQPMFAEDASGNVYDVTGKTPGLGADQFRCVSSTPHCLYSNQALTNQIPGAVGQFVPGENLEPIED